MNDKPTLIAEQIKHKIGNRHPEVLIVLGSGLGDFANEVENRLEINYADIDGFPVSTVSGHKGKLIAGKVCGKEVLCMQGRVHLYEGYAPSLIADIIKAFKLIGIKTMVVTNAAGSLKKDIKPGTLMLITDHLNMSGFNPLIGANDERYGPRFPNMNNVYCAEYQKKAERIAENNDIELNKGVYCMVSGPAFETPAEVKLYAILGADANGMSTVPETMSAVYCGIKVLGISAITNYCTGVEGGYPTHDETLKNAAKTAEDMTKLVKSFIGEL